MDLAAKDSAMGGASKAIQTGRRRSILLAHPMLQRAKTAALRTMIAVLYARSHAALVRSGMILASGQIFVLGS